MRTYTKILLFSVYFVFHDLAIAQTPTRLQGTLYHAETERPIAFAYIIVNQGAFIAQTDLDGNFDITFSVPVERVAFSCAGYESFEYVVQTPEDLKPLQRFLRIPLSSKTAPTTAESWKDSPLARGLIQKILKNRHLHNPSKVPFYSYHSYHKFFIDLEPKKEITLPAPSDSAKYKVAQFIKHNYLFLAETITKHSFHAPTFVHEQVIANKVSGFENPAFVAFGAQWQFLNFYQDYITILRRKFLNPISENSWQKYEFMVQDTLLVKPDTVFWIAFKPRTKKMFDGLQGRIAIHSRTYAIQSIEIRSGLTEKEAGLGFRLEQQYEWINKTHWFPRQVRTEFMLRRVKIGNRRVIAQWNTRFSDFDFKNKPPLWSLKTVFKDVAIQADSTALTQTKQFWGSYRLDTLRARELRTYQSLGAVGKSEGFDSKIRFLETALFGRIPLNFLKDKKWKWSRLHILDFDVFNSFNFNRYEFIRLGAALQTNDKFSKRYVLGAHLAYGTRDGNFKYGFWAQYKPFKSVDATFTARFSSEVAEPARISFMRENTGIVIIPNREFFIGRMDKVRRFELKGQARILQNLRVGLIFRTQRVLPTYAYTDRYQMTELNFQAQYFWRVKYLPMGSARFLAQSNLPALFVGYTQGMRAFGSTFRYAKWQARVRHEHTFRHIGTTQGELWLGLSRGEIPYHALWHGQGTGVAVPPFITNFFQTMGTYEFLTDRFMYVFLRHNFRKLLYKSYIPWFQPEPTLHHSFGWGGLREVNTHLGDISTQTLKRGYWESGFVINNLLLLKIKKVIKVGIGGGTFLRYGAYRDREKFGNNLAYKFALNIGI